MKYLDILIVYSDLAVSASVSDSVGLHPFSLNSKQANYNQCYKYFFEYCKKRGLTAGLSVSNDVISSGSCSSYWTYEQNKWVKNKHKVKSTQIFDKLAPITKDQIEKQALLFSDEAVKPFTDKEVITLFFDKHVTYKTLPEFSIPTVEINSNNVSDITKAITRLQKDISSHKNRHDFKNELILKDRFGSGGNNIFKIENDFVKNVQKKMDNFYGSVFILQPFVKFDTGFTFNNYTGSTDIRLIFQNNKLLQSYFRFAKPGDFRCNEHLGGELTYVTRKDVPKKVISVAKKIVAQINKPRSLYALDFIISNTGNIYLVEGNHNPGIDWDSSKKINEDMSKKLIESIVEEFIHCIKISKNSNTLSHSLDNSNTICEIENLTKKKIFDSMLEDVFFNSDSRQSNYSAD